MIGALTAYYRRQGILSTEFTCRFKDDCLGNCDAFTGPTSARVPLGYEARGYADRRYPRVVVVSLDSGSGGKKDEDRLPESVRQRSPELGRKNSHWYRTHVQVQAILQLFIDAELTVEDATHLFAHVNSAKCSQNKDGRGQADRRLFDNCRDYLREELDLLGPDILLSQGNWAHYGVNASIEEPIRDPRPLCEPNPCKVRLGERTVVWLRTYHPTSRGYYVRQARQTGEWAQSAEEIKRLLTES